MQPKYYADLTTSLLITFLCSLRYCDTTNDLEILQHKTKAEQFNPGCPRGCGSCSLYNGCITCKSSHHLLLTWKGSRQIGVCVRTCPAGYYSSQKYDFLKCTKCSVEHCSVCHNATVCFSCSAPRFLYEGQCVEDCAALNFIPNEDNTPISNNDNGSNSNYNIVKINNNSSNRSNRSNATNSKTCRFRESVDCSVGDWSPWTPCMRRKSICGYKKGRQMRTRQIIDFPIGSGRPCPSIYEKRKCKMKYRFCEDLISADDFDFSRMMIRLSPAKWRRLLKKKENFESQLQKSTEQGDKIGSRRRKKRKDGKLIIPPHALENRELFIGNIHPSRNTKRSKHLPNQPDISSYPDDVNTSTFEIPLDAGPILDMGSILNKN